MTTETMNAEIVIAPIKTTCADRASEEAQGMLVEAQNIKIVSQAQYENAAMTLKTIKNFAKQLDDERTKITRPMDAAKKAVLDLFRKPALILEQAELTVKRSMIAYTTEQERIAIAEQRRQEEIARKEQEKLMARAEKAEASGKVIKADVLREQAQQIVAPTIAPQVQKVSGISERTVWDFEVVDEAAIPREWLVPDLKTIGGAIRSTQGKINIPGVRAIPKKILAA